jgi:hypothetical protein
VRVVVVLAQRAQVGFIEPALRCFAHPDDVVCNRRRDDVPGLKAEHA